MRSIFPILALAVSSTLMAAVVKPPAFDPHRLSDDVRTLSSDAFEGRGPATPAETKVIDYVISQWKDAGLQPAGDLINGKR
ncbi:MAG: peptidase M20, partial [Rhodanobacter sp.]